MENPNHTNLNPTTSQIPTNASSGFSPETDIAFDATGNKEGVTHLTAPGPSALASWTPSRILYPIQEAQSPLTMLSRPTIIASGTAVSGAITLAASETVSSLGTPAVTAARAVTTGALGIKATVCYRVEIAAAPQVSGIYRLAVERFPPPTNFKSLARCVVSQLPGVEVNVVDGASATLRVPFVHDRDFWPLVNASPFAETVNSSFVVTLWAYSPITWDTTTVSAPSWILYRWLEDVELIGQSSALATITPQGANPESKVGAVSSWLGLGASVAGALSTIPTLASIAIPARWALGSMARVASYFGYSKPYEGSLAGTMAMSFTRGVNTCADRDQLQPLAMFSNNSIETSTNFAGNPHDEMAISYIASRPGMIAQFRWKASDLAGTCKWTCPVTPGAMFFQTSATGGFPQAVAQTAGQTGITNKLGFYPSPLLYVSSNFNYWRGGLCFRFKFARTKFHAGKLLIGYIPSADLTSDATTLGVFKLGPAALARYDYQSTLIDIRTTSEYDFMIPYIYPTPWCPTDLVTAKYAAGFNQHATGILFVQAVDALYGPDNVPQDITVTVEVMACPDFELAGPITSQLAPVYYDQSPLPTIIAQAVEPCPDTHGLSICKLTTGERILSVKQLMSRPSWCYANPKATSGTYRGTAVRHATPYGTHHFTYATNGTLPYKSPTYTNTTVAGSLNSNSIAPTIVAFYSMMYGLQRGSYVMRAIPANSILSAATVPPVGAASWIRFQSSIFLVPTNGSDIRYSALAIEANTGNGVNIPFYGRNDRVRTYNSGLNGQDIAYTPFLSLFDADSNCFLGISAGDDFQLGAFNGVPPVVFLDVPVTSIALPDQALNIMASIPPPA